MQTVGVADRLGKAGSPVYERWQNALLQYRDGKQPKYGAIWLTYYPHIMVEWYPHVLTVSTLHPIGPRKTMNMVEFYYPEEICAFEREFVEAQQAAYMETCVEDDEIAERIMDAGRKALMRRGDNEIGDPGARPPGRPTIRRRAAARASSRTSGRSSADIGRNWYCAMDQAVFSVSIVTLRLV